MCIVDLLMFMLQEVVMGEVKVLLLWVEFRVLWTSTCYVDRLDCPHIVFEPPGYVGLSVMAVDDADGSNSNRKKPCQVCFTWQLCSGAWNKQ
jgi:hypothetical protein